MLLVLDQDKIQGCFWGLALGDALGQPVEFNHIDVIQKRYGLKGIQEPKARALWTDDTEMTFAVTRALLRLGSIAKIEELDENSIRKVFAEEFITWSDNPGCAPGPTCMQAVNFLRSHPVKYWRSAGQNDSKGSGSVMRAAPLGLWFADAIAPELSRGRGKIHDLLIQVSTLQSEITHGHKVATAAALAGAYSVALAVNNTQPRDMVKPIQRICNEIHPDFAGVMSKLGNVLYHRVRGEINNDIEALHAIGLGWTGEEAFAMALYSVIQFPDDFRACLQTAVNHNGDSDSVGCIAGSIVGALYGIKCLPLEWINRLAERQRMDQMLLQVCTFFSGHL
ncbi:MAG: ADP-ribosylglycohydrolase [Promethearchaeota archaeon CR_4]|nr:MAG: ADP-ribosylglycohydrolase [Candidatus Lokiarchaeota archaeon CR_4]